MVADNQFVIGFGKPFLQGFISDFKIVALLVLERSEQYNSDRWFFCSSGGH
jgi:hypothetical protein